MKFIIFFACPAPSYILFYFPVDLLLFFFQRHQKIRPPIGFPLDYYQNSTALLFSSIFAKNRYRRSIEKSNEFIAGFVSTTIIATVTIVIIVIIVIIANIVNFATIRCNRSLHYFFCFCSFFLYFYLPI